jgi:diaminopimelate epimerase
MLRSPGGRRLMHINIRAKTSGFAGWPGPAARAGARPDNRAMHIRFTKMQGAGNDFVVLDETQGRLGLTPAQYRFLADRHFGVGADQILTVRPSPAAGVDFEYVIHNADGGEVEQCGNGARCFARYVRDKGLTGKDAIRVQTLAGVIEPRLAADGRVTVDMGRPVFAPERVPFDASGLVPVPQGSGQKWPLALEGQAQEATVLVAVVSMGNPHAVQLVDDVDTAPVARTGPLVEGHARFPQRVNAGFLQIVSRSEVRLRVYERGAGETLACGSGACAAVAAGIRLGLLEACVDVHTRGGLLTIAWSGSPEDSVFMTGPATTVFEGQIDIPDAP